MDKKLLRHIGILATTLGVSVIITQTPAKAAHICKCIGETTNQVYQEWHDDIESRFPYTSFVQNCLHEHYGFDSKQVGDKQYQVICDPPYKPR